MLYVEQCMICGNQCIPTCYCATFIGGRGYGSFNHQPILRNAVARSLASAGSCWRISLQTSLAWYQLNRRGSSFTELCENPSCFLLRWFEFHRILAAIEAVCPSSTRCVGLRSCDSPLRTSRN